MQWKFQREYHSLQDKAHKREYQEDFIAESQFKSSPIHLEDFKRMLAYGKRRLERDAEFRAHKEQLILRYLEGVFRLETREFRFRWSLNEYVAHNHVVDHCNRTYREHKKLAAHDFSEIETAIREAPAAWGVSKAGRQQLQITFTASILCDSITPYRSPGDDIDARPFFKRVG